MKISGLQKFSLIDYPEKISAVIFTQGCNFRCSYCHNPELLPLKNGSLKTEEVLDFLEKRKGKIEAVVITGGEPILQEDLVDFLKTIKEKKFLIKLDTNGSDPEILKKILDEKLVDYVAMDIKAPWKKYEEIVSTKIDLDKIKRSVDIVMKSKIDYEFRTTVAKEQLSFEDIEKICIQIKGAKKYFLQKYIGRKDDKKTADKYISYSDEKMNDLKEMAQKYLKEVFVR